MIVARDLIWFTVRNRSTGAAYSEGYWSDLHDATLNVVSAQTGATVSRLYRGAGRLISIPAIPMTSNLTVQRIDITLSQVDDRINDLIRDFDPRQGVVEISRAFFDLTTRAQTAPAAPIFFGSIDGVPVETPPEGGAGSVVVTAVTATAETLRSNPATRSDEDQRLRSPTDNFYQDVSTAGQKEIWWGTRKAPPEGDAPSAPVTGGGAPVR